MILITVAMLALVEQAAAAEPKYQTGLDLLENCRELPKLQAYGGDITFNAGESMTQAELDRQILVMGGANKCAQYITGFYDALVISGVARPAGKLICAPDKSSHHQAHLVVLKFLQDHPERLHQHQAILVADALVEAFPCKSRK